MRAAILTAVPAVMLAMAPATAAVPDAKVRALIERFDAARAAHDRAALARTLAPDYDEVSPVGDVDSRDAVLGFYADAPRRPAPPMTTDQWVVRSRGDIAIVTARKSFGISGESTRSIRVRHVARRIAGTWRLVSTQYTPIPPVSAG